MGPRKAQSPVPAGGGRPIQRQQQTRSARRRAEAPTRSTSAFGNSLHENRDRNVRLRSSVEITARAAMSLPSASPTPVTRPALRLMSVTSRPQVISAPASAAAVRSASPSRPRPPAAMPPGAARQQLKCAAGQRRVADPPVQHRRQQRGRARRRRRKAPPPPQAASSGCDSVPRRARARVRAAANRAALRRPPWPRRPARAR